jgi:hypothetical protein
MGPGIVAGAAAGLAGTTALDAATDLDMAVHGRPSSGTMARRKVSDPREWSGRDRLGDLLPTSPTRRDLRDVARPLFPVNVPLAGPLVDGKCCAGVNVVNL